MKHFAKVSAKTFLRLKCMSQNDLMDYVYDYIRFNAEGTIISLRGGLDSIRYGETIQINDIGCNNECNDYVIYTDGLVTKRAKTISSYIGEIVQAKVASCTENQFVYLSRDGRILIGNKNDLGHNYEFAFGGPKKTQEEALEFLVYQIESEPYEFQL